jgi:hypothetical protein
LSPETVARLTPLIVGVVISLIFAISAMRAEVRSRRLARTGLACAVSVLPLAGAAFLAGSAERQFVFVGAGLLAVVGGVAAMVLAVRARIAKTKDGGTGNLTPAVALVLGVLGTVLGCSLAAIPFAVHGMGGGVAWTYKHPSPGFEVTLPSERWRKADKPSVPGEYAIFFCPSPEMRAQVPEIRPAGSLEQFEQAVNELKVLFTRHQYKIIEEKQEPNANGHTHWRFIVDDNTPDRRVMVGMSVTWWNKSHAVVLIFEGHYKMKSQLWQSQETDAFRAAATSILSSVK